MNILEKLVTAGCLEKATLSVKRSKTKEKRKTSRGADKVTIQDFLDDAPNQLEIIRAGLRNGSYKMNSLLPVVIPKPLPKQYDRLLAVPSVRDRVLQKAILDTIYPYIHEHISSDVSFCGIRTGKGDPKKNIESAMRRIVELVKRGNFVVFESDIVSFFDKVCKKSMLAKTLKLISPDDSITWLLNDVINYTIEMSQKIRSNPRVQLPNEEVSISQGSALSPLFSNIYLAEFDKKMQEVFGDSYIRYVDDFIVMCKTREEAEKAYKLATKAMREEGLELSPLDNKTHIKDLRDDGEAIKFLGISISKSAITIPGTEAEQKRKISDILFPNTKPKNGEKRLNQAQIIGQINARIQGWVTFYKYYHVDEIFNKINVLIKKKKEAEITKEASKNLQMIDLKILKPIISQKEWISLFSMRSNSSEK